MIYWKNPRLVVYSAQTHTQTKRCTMVTQWTPGSHRVHACALSSVLSPLPLLLYIIFQKIPSKSKKKGAAIIPNPNRNTPSHTDPRLDRRPYYSLLLAAIPIPIPTLYFLAWLGLASICISNRRG